jgi:hypothetical protein
VEVLHWADIVRASMARGVVAGYAELGRTAWIYLSSGALFRLMRLRKGPVIAALYPVVVLLGELVLAVALGAGTGLALHALLVPVLGRFAAGVLATGLGAGIAWALLTWFRRRDPLMAWYLMHDYAFSARHAAPIRRSRRRGWANSPTGSGGAGRGGGRGAGRRPFLGRLPRGLGPGRPDPRRAGASRRGRSCRS